MKKFPKWLVHLFPSRDRTFWQRFVGILLTWGLPIMVWEIIRSGVLRAPSQWPFFLTLEVAGIVVGATFYALVEHLFYRSFPKSDYQPH
jgi:hypothetical protein